MAIDYEAEGLLDGLDGDTREARLALLERLTGDGVPLDELKQAAAEGRLALLPVERVLEGDLRRYNVAEVAEMSGLDRDFFEAVLRAMGVARPGDEERDFTEADIHAAQRIKAAREAGIPDDEQLEIIRAMSRGLANIATTVTRVFGRAFLLPGDTEDDVATRYADASQALSPVLSEALLHIFNVHMREEIRQAAVGQAEIESGSLPAAQDMTICFADLVGFTRLGERIEGPDGRVLQQFQPSTARKLNINPTFRQAILEGLRGGASAAGAQDCSTDIGSTDQSTTDGTTDSASGGRSSHQRWLNPRRTRRSAGSRSAHGTARSSTAGSRRTRSRGHRRPPRRSVRSPRS